MFARPQSPTSAIVIGVGAILFSFVSLPLLFADFVAEKNFGMIVVGLIAMTFLLGIYQIVLGSMWRARDRRDT